MPAPRFVGLDLADGVLEQLLEVSVLGLAVRVGERGMSGGVG